MVTDRVDPDDDPAVLIADGHQPLDRAFRARPGPGLCDQGVHVRGDGLPDEAFDLPCQLPQTRRRPAPIEEVRAEQTGARSAVHAGTGTGTGTGTGAGAVAGGETPGQLAQPGAVGVEDGAAVGLVGLRRPTFDDVLEAEPGHGVPTPFCGVDERGDDLLLPGDDRSELVELVLAPVVGQAGAAGWVDAHDPNAIPTMVWFRCTPPYCSPNVLNPVAR